MNNSNSSTNLKTLSQSEIHSVIISHYKAKGITVKKSDQTYKHAMRLANNLMGIISDKKAPVDRSTLTILRSNCNVVTA